MHELSLAQNALQVILETAAKQQFSKVVKIVFDIGKLSCVQKEALEFAMQSAIENTLAEEAEIAVTEIDGELQCRHCQQIFSAPELYTPCPRCGEYGANIIAGQETALSFIEGI